MINDEYSPYKIVHNMELIRKIKNKENFYPQQVHFVPMNVCNHNCSFCAYRMDGYSSSQKFNDRDWIKEEKCIEILTDLKNGGTKAIQFTGGGEPTVHPKINNIFRHTLDLGLELALVTNGMKMNDETIELLSRAQWVRFSLDSFDKNTYSSIRKVSPDKMDIVKDNIRKLIAIKSKDTVVGVGFVVTKENYKEVYECAKMCKEMGVDNFRISASFTPLKEKYFDGFLQESRELCAKTKSELETKEFTVFNLFGDRLSDLFDGVQDYDYCPMKDLVVYIGADLNVYTCCVLSYNDNGRIGSLENQTFAEFWESDEKKKFYDSHSPKTHCKLPCMFEKKNDFINYILKPTPKHTNFI